MSMFQYVFVVIAIITSFTLWFLIIRGLYRRYKRFMNKYATPVQNQSSSSNKDGIDERRLHKCLETWVENANALCSKITSAGYVMFVFDDSKYFGGYRVEIMTGTSIFTADPDFVGSIGEVFIDDFPMDIQDSNFEFLRSSLPKEYKRAYLNK